MGGGYISISPCIAVVRALILTSGEGVIIQLVSLAGREAVHETLSERAVVFRELCPLNLSTSHHIEIGGSLYLQDQLQRRAQCA